MINSMHSLIFGSHFDWPFSKLKILYVVWIAILATTACLRKRQWNPMDTVHVKSIQVWILEQTFWINFRASKLVWVDCTPSRALAGKGQFHSDPATCNCPFMSQLPFHVRSVQLRTVMNLLEDLPEALRLAKKVEAKELTSGYGMVIGGPSKDVSLSRTDLFICLLWFHKATKPIHKSRFIVLIMRLTKSCIPQRGPYRQPWGCEHFQPICCGLRPKPLRLTLYPRPWPFWASVCLLRLFMDEGILSKVRCWDWEISRCICAS